MTRDFVWFQRFHELQAYKQIHGHCEVPQKHGQLGRWVHRQRESKHKFNLSAMRMKQLDDLGFVWRQKSSRPTDTWDERFSQLTAYKTEHGHTNVPQSYEKIPGLGRWVNRQRTAKAKDELDARRLAKLESLGFSFNTKNFLWDVRFHELVQFKEAKGHVDVPYGWYENKELSKWVQKQRYLYTLKSRGNKSNLTDERQQKLNSLGFVWNASSTSWDTHYHALVEYKKRYGNCNVPRPYADNPKLSNWVYNHRSEYSRKRRGLKNNLTEEREEKLNSLGFAWVLKQKGSHNHLDSSSYEGHDERDDCSMASAQKRGIDCMGRDDDRSESSGGSSKKQKNEPMFVPSGGPAYGSVQQPPSVGSSWVAASSTASSSSVSLLPVKSEGHGLSLGNRSLTSFANFDEDQVLVASQLLNLKSCK